VKRKAEEETDAVSGAAGGSSGEEAKGKAKGDAAAEDDTERASGDCDAEPLPLWRCVGVGAPCWECEDGSNMQRDRQRRSWSLAATSCRQPLLCCCCYGEK
jgi:hypothetical protein